MYYCIIFNFKHLSQKQHYIDDHYDKHIFFLIRPNS